MPDVDSRFPDPASSTALRWSVTVQALLGAAILLAWLAAALYLLLYSTGLTGAPLWRGAVWQAAFRLALAVPAVAIGRRVLGWLWAPPPAPAGISLARRDAPDFFALIDRVGPRFGIALPIHVAITGEMNAAIVAHPRRVTLQIGLPLLLSVTARQCAAVLAHEFGHLCVRRQSLGAWASHLHAWWHRVLARLDHDRSLTGRAAAALLARADRRYLADCLRLARTEEFEADAWAARTIGAEPLADALHAMALKEQFLREDFLRKVHAQADHRRLPSILPFRQMAAALKAGFDRDAAWAALGGGEDGDGDDAAADLLHPSMRARCARLAVDPAQHPGDAALAADVYLQPVLPRLIGTLDRAWWARRGQEWSRRHREVLRARSRIAALEARGDRLSAAERFELACLEEGYCPERDPLRHYLELRHDPDLRSLANLAAGRLLLERGDPEGAVHLLRAVKEDSDVGLSAAAHLLSFAEAHDLEALEKLAVGRAASLLKLAEAVRRDSAGDPRGCGWQPHGLDVIALRQLRRHLLELPRVRRAYLVRRIAAAAPRWRAYVLVVRSNREDAAFAGRLAGLVEPLLARECPLQVVLVKRGSEWEWMAGVVPASLVYVNPRRAPPAGSP